MIEDGQIYKRRNGRRILLYFLNGKQVNKSTGWHLDVIENGGNYMKKRTLLVLKYTYKEIAYNINITESSVKDIIYKSKGANK